MGGGDHMRIDAHREMCEMTPWTGIVGIGRRDWWVQTKHVRWRGDKPTGFSVSVATAEQEE